MAHRESRLSRLAGPPPVAARRRKLHDILYWIKNCKPSAQKLYRHGRGRLEQDLWAINNTSRTARQTCKAM